VKIQHTAACKPVTSYWENTLLTAWRPPNYIANAVFSSSDSYSILLGLFSYNPSVCHFVTTTSFYVPNSPTSRHKISPECNIYIRPGDWDEISVSPRFARQQKAFINTRGVNSAKSGYEAHFMSFAAIVASRNGTEGSNYRHI
jgi:hypothetical protein